MLENNRHLIDQITGTVSGTIPIWRNQITILLGIEKKNRNLEILNKSTEAAQNYIAQEKSNSRIKKRRCEEINVEKLLQTNDILKQVLEQLNAAEKRESDIKLELCSALR